MVAEQESGIDGQGSGVIPDYVTFVNEKVDGEHYYSGVSTETRLENSKEEEEEQEEEVEEEQEEAEEVEAQEEEKQEGLEMGTVGGAEMECEEKYYA